MIRLAIPSIDYQEERAVQLVLRSGFLVQGKTVAQFEEAVASYLDVKYAVAVNSGTSALHLALLALDIGHGDEVIVPDYTFPATANVVELAGAKPVFVDIDPATFNINPKAVERCITKRTKAIIPVHLFGQSADLAPIMRLAKKYKLKVVEDAACVLGAEYKGRKCGIIGDVGCFSFHPRKIITTGEGGMVVTDNSTVAGRLKILRNHGIAYKNNKIDFVAAGFNYRMTEIQAAIGLVQLKKIEALIGARRKVAGLYNAQLSSINWIKIPRVPADNTHVFQTYIIQISGSLNSGQLIEYLRKNGVEANFGTYALHKLTYYKNKYHLRNSQFPVSENVFKTSIALPVFEHLSINQIRRIAAILRKFQQ